MGFTLDVNACCSAPRSDLKLGEVNHTLETAAGWLNMHPRTLIERARAGKIPGAAKPGKRWVFPEAGLQAYLNSLAPCPFTAEAQLGGSSSPRTAKELENLLGLPTRRRQRSTTRNEGENYGGRKD